jgi:D-3-phosphoglycerate dehydrogenase
MKPEVIVRVPFPKESIALLQEDFTVHYAPSPEELDVAIREHGANARAMVTNGSIGLDGARMRALPKLEIIHTIGVGYEQVDLETARERKISVATNVGTNCFAVAEQAIGLLLALYGNIPGGDQAARNGLFEEARQPRPLIYEKKVGIIGLGDVGMDIATRVEAFKATVLYHNRKPREGVSYTYYNSPLELAEASDILMIACPGGPATRHIVNREVLTALGPKGILINVGRGSVVANETLAQALHDGIIAGAGIDVWEGEPVLPQVLIDAPRLIVSPHIGGRAIEATIQARRQISQNFKAHFAGGKVLHRVV